MSWKVLEPQETEQEDFWANMNNPREEEEDDGDGSDELPSPSTQEGKLAFLRKLKEISNSHISSQNASQSPSEKIIFDGASLIRDGKVIETSESDNGQREQKQLQDKDADKNNAFPILCSSSTQLSVRQNSRKPTFDSNGTAAGSTPNGNNGMISSIIGQLRSFSTQLSTKDEASVQNENVASPQSNQVIPDKDQTKGSNKNSSFLGDSKSTYSNLFDQIKGQLSPISNQTYDHFTSAMNGCKLFDVCDPIPHVDDTSKQDKNKEDLVKESENSPRTILGCVPIISQFDDGCNQNTNDPYGNRGKKQSSRSAKNFMSGIGRKKNQTNPRQKRDTSDISTYINVQDDFSLGDVSAMTMNTLKRRDYLSHREIIRSGIAENRDRQLMSEKERDELIRNEALEREIKLEEEALRQRKYDQSQSEANVMIIDGQDDWNLHAEQNNNEYFHNDDWNVVHSSSPLSGKKEISNPSRVKASSKYHQDKLKQKQKLRDILRTKSDITMDTFQNNSSTLDEALETLRQVSSELGIPMKDLLKEQNGKIVKELLSL